MAAATLPAVGEFRIRGHYPNLRSLLSNMRFRAGGEGADLAAADADSGRPGRETDRARPALPGYHPPIVEYALEDGGRGAELAVRDIDLPMLCQEAPEGARRHLSLILLAREGDTYAEAGLEEAVRRHFRALQERGAAAEPDEDRFLVPSTSSETYPVETVSHKGSILLKLSQLGYPVPDFVILTAEAYPERGRLEGLLGSAVRNLERLTLQGLGSARDPLVFALRCATPMYVPGVMPTYLNVGVTEGVLPSLDRLYGPEASRKMFLNNLRNLLSALDPEGYAALAGKVRPDPPYAEVLRLAERFADAVRAADPALLRDPLRQALFLARQAYRQFEDGRDLLLTLSRGVRHHPALILQKMVCTVRNEQAYAGVLYSRNSRTGAGHNLESARNIFGEEIMTGTVAPEETAFRDRSEVKEAFPAVYHFVPQLAELEREFKGPVTIEFAAEAARRHQFFALLQLNATGMTGRAAFISVVDLHQAGVISRRRVTELICPYHVKQMESDTIDSASIGELERFSSGAAVLPRAAVSARIFFSADTALRAKREGEKVCFCKRSFEPPDTVVMREMDAIVSLTSAAIHVATICQSFGMPSLLSLEKDGVRLLPGGRIVNAAGVELREGDWITISSRRKALFRGKARFKPARFMRYLKGEEVPLDAREREAFEAMAYAYRCYHQLLKGLRLDSATTLNDVVRLVNLELRGQAGEAKSLVRSWFDGHEDVYVEEVLKCELGDHLNQHTVFDMLDLDRKTRFFKAVLDHCARRRLSGYGAGAFMLGRFISPPQPVAFWKAFAPVETALLVNEWLLFEKYMQVLNDVGERKVLRARKRLLAEGLGELPLEPRAVFGLVPLKLSGAPLASAQAAVPDWADPQTARALELLREPYRAFYDYSARWSLAELEKLCAAAGLPVPGPDDR